jgi:two-component system nitrogen regulation sensor histidine kinase NtrY
MMRRLRHVGKAGNGQADPPAPACARLARRGAIADNGGIVRRPFSLLPVFAIGTVSLGAIVAAGIAWALHPGLGWPFALLAVAAVAILLLVPWFARGLRLLGQIEDGLARLTGGDFTASLDDADAGPLGALAGHFNALGASLREHRATAEQSTLLLHTLIDAAPMAILLLEDGGAIEYANDTARGLFFEGRELGQANFLALLGDAPAAFREAVLSEQDRLFSVTVEGVPETYHLAKRHFDLHGGTHTLLMVKHLTRELRRQEIEVWKKLVRVVSHELNNSLAPIKSLVHSARIMTRSDHDPKLDRVFSTIDERASHLQSFVESYARFARLPSPRREEVSLREFLAHIGTLVTDVRILPPAAERHGHFDRSQLEQVIINLLKNAREAGGPVGDIVLEVKADAAGTVTLVVCDRGPGMSAEVLESAMLPFYSTKEGGSGLGLALCREIIEAHGGDIRLENRDGGGLAVTCVIPGATRPATSSKARLTLSHV